MPVEFAAWTASRISPQAFYGYLSGNITVFIACVAALVAISIRHWAKGSSNPFSDAPMHGKVILITGGTSGIGAAVVEALALQGAQLVLLVRSVQDGWLQDYVTDLRERTKNELIYVEECDLSNLLSIRRFATKWIDSTPARRIDQIILCAGIAEPVGKKRSTTADGVEVHLGVNYLANFHLLSILSPVIRAQPPDRDVRVIFLTCTLYILGDLDVTDLEYTKRKYNSRRPWHVFGASKLALMSFAGEFQRRLETGKTPDRQLSHRCILVDPGLARTPSFRRFVTLGSLWGLSFYLSMYPFWFIFVKSAAVGAQSVLFASMAPASVHDNIRRIVQGIEIISDCQAKDVKREEVVDQKLALKLWEASEILIEQAEKRGAVQRNLRKDKTNTKLM